jgi:hypothetical protein
MRNTTVFGPTKSEECDSEETNRMLALKSALDLSAYMNESMKHSNVGPKRFLCKEVSRVDSRNFPIDNFDRADCVIDTYKREFYSAADERSSDNDVSQLNLEGDELVYNTFYVKDVRLLNEKKVRISVPNNSFVIINVEGKGHVDLSINELVISSKSNVDESSVVLNLFRATSFDLAEEKPFRGTIFAPMATFVNMDGRRRKEITGQIIAKDIKLDNFYQKCSNFEPFS